MIHLTPQQLSSYMDGELNEVSTELVRRHMGICEECTLKFAALEDQEEQLSHALVHEPGEDFFDRFATEVERQLPPGPGSRRGPSSPAARAAAVREAASEAAREAAISASLPTTEAEVENMAERPGAAMRPAPALHAAPEAEPLAPIPGAPAPSTPAAPMPAAAMPDETDDLDADETITALTADLSSSEPDSIPTPTPERSPARPHVPEASPRRQEAKAPPRRPPALAAQRPAPQRPAPRRPKIRRPAPSIPWYAAVILAALAGAAGVVVSRTDPVSAWLDSHGLRSLLPSAANPAGARDPFAGLPPAPLEQVRAAQRSKAAADAQPSAERYDAAADEWELAIPLLRGARQQSLSRLELASSRYRAWESEPTQARAASAASAIRAYLAFAPQGAPRDLVRNWLARVGH